MQHLQVTSIGLLKVNLNASPSDWQPRALPGNLDNITAAPWPSPSSTMTSVLQAGCKQRPAQAPLLTTACASAGKGQPQRTASVVKTAATPGQRKSTESLRASTSGSLGSSLAAAESLPAAPASSTGSSRRSVSGAPIGTQAELQRGSARGSLPARVDRMELQRPQPQARLCSGAASVDIAPWRWLLCWSSA